MRRVWIAFFLVIGAYSWFVPEGSKSGVDVQVKFAPPQNETAIVASKPDPTPANAQSGNDASKFVRASPPQQNEMALFVRGKRVAFRKEPDKQSPIIDRLNSGDAVILIEREPEWSKVIELLTRREGWIANHLLADKKPVSVEQHTTPKLPDKPKAMPTEPVLSDAVIIQKIIMASIARYRGSCPCPFNVDRGGRSCGRRSAYSKPGGAAPICYEQDVSNEMIEQMRARLN